MMQSLRVVSLLLLFFTTLTSLGACGREPASPAVSAASAAAPFSAPAADAQAYRIVSVDSNQALQAGSPISTGGTAIVQAPYTGGAQQRWTLAANLDGSYRVVNVQSGQCLDVIGMSQANGAPLQAWPCWHSANQFWNLLPVAGGSFKLSNVNSAMVLGLTPTGDVQQQDDLRQATGSWRLEAVDAKGAATQAAAPVDSIAGRPGRLLLGFDPGATYFNGKFYLLQADFDQHVTVYRSSALKTILSDEAFIYTNTTDVHLNSEAADLAVVTDPRDGQKKLAIYITKTYPFPGSIKVLITADPAQGFEDRGFLAGVDGYDPHPMAHPNGTLYMLFSTFSDVKIAPMSDPWTLRSPPVSIATATLLWETQNGTAINEAPTHVVAGDTLNLVYSANRYDDPNYLCGLLTIPTSDDPLDPNKWHKQADGPAFAAGNGHNGTGSGAFVSDGNDTWWLYDSFADPTVFNSEIRAQKISFTPSGQVVLGEPQ